MKNIVYKIISKHLVSGKLEFGEEVLINVDQAYMEDHSGVDIFARLLTNKINARSDRLTVCYTDHNILSKSDDTQAHLFLSDCCKKFGILYARSASGICHQLHAEHFAQPGMIILGANSHTPHCGGIGSLAFGVGGSELVTFLSNFPFALRIPRVVNIQLEGNLHRMCSAKDVALYLKRELSDVHNCIIEFSGSAIDKISICQRMLLSSMCVEMGALTGIFPSDNVTLEFLKTVGRESDWTSLYADEGAHYDSIFSINLDKIEPMIMLPTKTESIVEISKLKQTICVEQVIIGGCASGSFDDMLILNSILNGRIINESTSLIIQPSTKKTLELMAENGLTRNFLKACAEITPPNCDACIGMSYVPTSNINSLRTFSRNYKGRSGCENDHVFLCSVETAAVSALTGKITDPRTFDNIKSELNFQKNNQYHYLQRDGFSFRKENDTEIRSPTFLSNYPLINKRKDIVDNVVVKLGDYISTDDILPHGTNIPCHRADIVGLSNYIFYRMNRGIAEKIKDNGGGWIIGGREFGRGSARENAAHVLAAIGIKGVLAKSFSSTYINNMVNYSLFPIEITDEIYQAINEGDTVDIKYLVDGTISIRNITTGDSFISTCVLTKHQRDILLSGGLFNYLIN